MMEIRMLLCVSTSRVWRPLRPMHPLSWVAGLFGLVAAGAFGHTVQGSQVGVVLCSVREAEAIGDALSRQTCGTMVWVPVPICSRCPECRAASELLLRLSQPAGGGDRLLAILGHAFGIACLRRGHRPADHGKNEGADRCQPGQ